jgi:cellulose synthase/poly-beta-1,6-N-acetylglucosamine synthase-like glycosyltransferase
LINSHLIEKPLKNTLMPQSTDNPPNYTIDVLIPAFNEENSVGKVIKDIPSFVRNIIVVNNNSND